jgi:hypothetical protein
MEAVKLVIWAGQMSTEKRNEVQLLHDVIGLESEATPHNQTSF